MMNTFEELRAAANRAGDLGDAAAAWVCILLNTNPDLLEPGEVDRAVAKRDALRAEERELRELARVAARKECGLPC